MVALVGRGEQRAAIAARLTEGARLVTLIGPTGVGKTRVAKEVAGHAPLCELADAHSLEQVRAALSVRLGVAAQDEPALRRALAEHELVVLDNLEQVVDEAATTIGNWAEVTPLLVTSRERLNVSGEVVMVLEPLDVPAIDADADAILASPAVQLFFSAARAAGAEIDAVDTSQLAAIVRALDGLPLAIELAAARLHALGPQTLLDQLTHPLRALSQAPRDAPAHHASLERAVQVSWDTLDESARRALGRLAVFAGSFTVAAAAHVLEVSDVAALERLEALCNKSLLQPGDGSFRMLSPVRAFAAARAEQAGELDGPVLRLQAEALFWQSNYDASLARLDVAEAVTDEPSERAHIDEVRCSVLRRLGHAEAAREAGERALRHATAEAAVRVRGALATLALEQGDLEQAHEEFSRVRDEAGADLRSAALAVGMIGHVEQELGHLDQAASAYEHAATAFAALPDPRLAAVYRGYRATVAHERGEPDADARYGAAIDEVAPHGHHFAGLFAACQGALRASQSDARAAESFSRADRELADCDDVAIRHAARIHRSWLDGDEALEPLAAGPTSDDVRFALRLVRARRAAADAMLTVGDGWVRFAGETIDLSRRKILWQLLMALVDGREQHPGRAVRRERLIEAAWGEERMLASAAAHRLRVAIHELRRKGLSAAIDSAPEGYRLACPVERSDAI